MKPFVDLTPETTAGKSGRRRRQRLAVSINTQGWHRGFSGLCHSGLEWQAAETQSEQGYSWCFDSRKEIRGTGWPISAQAWWDERRHLHWCQPGQLQDRGCHFLVNHVWNRTLEKQSSTSGEAALFKNNKWYVLLVWMLWGSSVTQFPSCFYVTFTGCFPFPNTRMIHMRRPASLALLKKNQDYKNHKII